MPKRRPSTAPEGKEITLPGGHEVLLTRRHFLYGAAGVAALAVLGGATAYANDHAKGSDDLAVLTVPQEAVYDSQGLEQIGAKVKGEKLGKARLLDEGDGNWEMPTLAVAGAYGFWQCLPQLNGDARVENSLLKRAQFGTDEAEVVYESQGRMACPPTSCGDAVIITPRARTSGTYYQMTKIDGASGTVTDACVLPTSMKPMECSYGPTGFNFAFEAIYDYGDGIANLGTYMPLTPVDTEVATPAPVEEDAAPDGEATVAASAAQAHSISIDQANAATEAYSDAPWFRYARTPVSAPCWCGNWLMIKGSTNMCVVNLEEKKFAALPLEEGADSYKDFLASSGMGKRAVTYSSVNHTPVNGEAEKCCKVRIWETK